MIIPSLYAGFTGVAEVPRIDIVPTAHFKRPNLLTRIGRNTYCEFSRPPNNMPILKMADSQNAGQVSKL